MCISMYIKHFPQSWGREVSQGVTVELIPPESWQCFCSLGVSVGELVNPAALG